MGIVVSRARARGNVVMMSATLPPKDVNVENTFLYDQLGGKGPVRGWRAHVTVSLFEQTHSDLRFPTCRPRRPFAQSSRVSVRLGFPI